jgi:hypothetical protein
MNLARFRLAFVSVGAVLAAIGTPVTGSTASSTHYAIECDESPLCLELNSPTDVFGNYYVGHDEPSALFYSTAQGSGNSSSYRVTLPKDPPTNPRNSFNFELHPAFWFGMALCNTQSYPEQVSSCPADTDSNIANNPDPNAPDYIGHHVGSAFLELQFYPPGWAPLPSAISCDATKWCVAMVIWSLAEDPIAGTAINSTCGNRIGGAEYPNYAFLTLSGVPHAPANPVDATLSTFTPNPSTDLFMNGGDRLTVDIHDTRHGLTTVVRDLTTRQTGSVTASAANSFGMVQYAPTGTACNNIPYDFHPMYSTSSEATRVIWAAHSYNVAFADEIGHFDFCSQVSGNGECANGASEGIAGDQERSDGDDGGCFRASASTLVQVSGCGETNTGFDGTSYQPDWPDGSPNHPTAILFGSPTTNGQNYQRVAFEANLPRIEAADFGGICNRTTGDGCTNPPLTDDVDASGNRTPAAFYPFFSTQQSGGQCTWAIGNDNPGVTINDFGGGSQYGPLLYLDYLIFGGGGSVRHITDNNRLILGSNPCPASTGD